MKLSNKYFKNCIMIIGGISLSIYLAMASDKEIHFPLSITTDYSYGGVISPKQGDNGIDGITGASKSSLQISVNGDIQLRKKHYIGTGIEFATVNYHLTYDVKDQNSTVKLDAFHLRIPLTYKFGFFNNQDDFSRLLLRTGVYVGIPLNDKITSTGNVPAEYEIRKSDIGLILGLHGYPITIHNDFHIGFLLNFYRGVVDFYDDHDTFKNPLATSNLGIEFKYTGL